MITGKVIRSGLLLVMVTSISAAGTLVTHNTVANMLTNSTTASSLLTKRESKKQAPRAESSNEVAEELKDVKIGSTNGVNGRSNSSQTHSHSTFKLAPDKFPRSPNTPRSLHELIGIRESRRQKRLALKEFIFSKIWEHKRIVSPFDPPGPPFDPPGPPFDPPGPPFDPPGPPFDPPGPPFDPPGPPFGRRGR